MHPGGWKTTVASPKSNIEVNRPKVQQTHVPMADNSDPHSLVSSTPSDIHFFLHEPRDERKYESRMFSQREQNSIFDTTISNDSGSGGVYIDGGNPAYSWRPGSPTITLESWLVGNNILRESAQVTLWSASFTDSRTSGPMLPMSRCPRRHTDRTYIWEQMALVNRN